MFEMIKMKLVWENQRIRINWEKVDVKKWDIVEVRKWDVNFFLAYWFIEIKMEDKKPVVKQETKVEKSKPAKKSKKKSKK